MNSLLKEIEKNSTIKGEFSKEIFAQLIVEKCCEVLNEKGLSIYDPNNKKHANKESWDRSLSWAIRNASEEIKNMFKIS